MTQALSRIYAERYKIGVPEWRVLVTLGEFGMMTAKAIGRHSHMHKTKVSRAVAQLERRKLVSRKANRADMREAFLSLTAAGRRSTTSWRRPRSTSCASSWRRWTRPTARRSTAC